MVPFKSFFIITAFFVFGIVFFFPVQGFSQSETSAKKVQRDTVVIVPRSEWHAQPARPYKQHVPVKITVHHEGGKVLTTTDDAKQRLKNVQTWTMGPDRKWADIPYHLLIPPDGTVYEGRNPLTVGKTNVLNTGSLLKRSLPIATTVSKLPVPEKISMLILKTDILWRR